MGTCILKAIMKSNWITFSAQIFLTLCQYNTEGTRSKILAIPLMYGSSHINNIMPLIKPLAQRHDVTVWWMTASKSRKEEVGKMLEGLNMRPKIILFTPQNIEHKKALDQTADAEMGQRIWVRSVDDVRSMHYWGWRYGSDLCKLAFQEHHELMREIWHTKWDLVLLDKLFTSCGYLFVALRQIPYVIMDVGDQATGSIHYARNIETPLSYVKEYNNYATSDFRKLQERMQNVYQYFKTRIYDDLNDAEVRTAHTGFRNASLHNFSSVNVRANALFAFQASSLPHIFEAPRPGTLDYNYFRIGCEGFLTYQHSTKDLTKLNHFLQDDSYVGIVILTSGRAISWKFVPDAVLQSLMRTFKHFSNVQFVTQLVGLENVSWPRNVMNVDWLPLEELLSNPKTLLFWNYLGTKSMLESICHGVPLIGTPIFCDQHRNSGFAQRLGFAAIIPHLKLNNSELVLHTVSEALDRDLALLKKRTEQVRSMMTQNGLLGQGNADVFLIDYYLRHKEHLAWIYPKRRHYHVIRNLCGDIALAFLASFFYLCWSYVA